MEANPSAPRIPTYVAPTTPTGRPAEGRLRGPVAPGGSAAGDPGRGHLARLGFPVMVKATGGIGGRGVREAETPGALPSALKSTRAAAWKWFGQATVFLERRLDGVRHVGVQVVSDAWGGEVEKRTAADPRVKEREAEVAAATGHEKARLRARLREVTRAVHSEKLAQVADEYDSVHSVERARRVGSVHEIIPASRLRPHLIQAVGKGIARELERVGALARA